MTQTYVYGLMQNKTKKKRKKRKRKKRKRKKRKRKKRKKKKNRRKRKKGTCYSTLPDMLFFEKYFACYGYE